jgi:tRNA G26 N,N-dimethylase Trm1
MLSFFQRLRLRVFGRVPVGRRKLPGWSGSLMFYLVKCKIHGEFITYPQGYNQRLECPKCGSTSLICTKGEVEK